MSRLLTIAEVREMLLRDPRLKGVAALCALPAVKVGAEWRIWRPDVDAWIANEAARRFETAH